MFEIARTYDCALWKKLFVNKKTRIVSNIICMSIEMVLKIKGDDLKCTSSNLRLQVVIRLKLLAAHFLDET